MPYINPEERKYLDPLVEEMGHRIPADKPGWLAYVLYAWFVRYCTPSWTHFCLIVGSMILTIFEMYRKVIGKYEDGKRRENGDIK
jgi:hypothetical protein